MKMPSTLPAKPVQRIKKIIHELILLLFCVAVIALVVALYVKFSPARANQPALKPAPAVTVIQKRYDDVTYLVFVQESTGNFQVVNYTGDSLSVLLKKDDAYMLTADSSEHQQ